MLNIEENISVGKSGENNIQNPNGIGLEL